MMSICWLASFLLICTTLCTSEIVLNQEINVFYPLLPTTFRIRFSFKSFFFVYFDNAKTHSLDSRQTRGRAAIHIFTQGQRPIERELQQPMELYMQQSGIQQYVQLLYYVVQLQWQVSIFFPKYNRTWREKKTGGERERDSGRKEEKEER